MFFKFYGVGWVLFFLLWNGFIQMAVLYVKALMLFFPSNLIEPNHFWKCFSNLFRNSMELEYNYCSQQQAHSVPFHLCFLFRMWRQNALKRRRVWKGTYWFFWSIQELRWIREPQKNHLLKIFGLSKHAHEVWNKSIWFSGGIFFFFLHTHTHPPSPHPFLNI